MNFEGYHDPNSHLRQTIPNRGAARHRLDVDLVVIVSAATHSEGRAMDDRSIIDTIVEAIEWCGFSLMLLGVFVGMFSLARFVRATL